MLWKIVHKQTLQLDKMEKFKYSLPIVDSEL